MTDKLKQTIKNEVGKLPIEVQEAISALDWTKITEEIGKKYRLSESEINDFQVETLLVLVGLEDGNYYAQNIEDNVGTSKDEAEKMADEAFTKIFTPINNILVENVKRSGKSKRASWNQTIDFILSGGDYSAFIEPTNSPLPEYPDLKSEGGGISTPSRQRATREEGNKTQETVLPVFSIKEENRKEKFNI